MNECFDTDVNYWKYSFDYVVLSHLIGPYCDAQFVLKIFLVLQEIK
jgi:hypothetical protein